MVGKNMSEIGKKYGKLTVIKKLDRKEHQTTVYLCRCDCGNFKEVNINKLHTGHVKTCEIDFDNDWQIKKQALNKIINNLVGLVTMNNEGLDYGKKFDDFLEKLLGDDVDVCSKLIKKLSIL